MKNYILIFFSIGVLALASCEKDKEPEYVYPKSYLPAYPGSYWDYTNGERVLSENNYVLHQYEEGVNSTKKTDEKYVPIYNGQYLYEYSITQSSTVYPLKKLLEESTGKSWEVNKINNEAVLRQVVNKIDTMIIKFPPFKNPIDSAIKDILVVVEYLDSLGAERWNTKEYYAKNIGLIRVDVNNPFDENPPIIQKQIQGYHINK